jgi:hypothetical protein
MVTAMTEPPKVHPAQVASPPRPVHLVTNRGNDLSRAERDGALAALDYVQRQIDALRRYIAGDRIADFDDGAA